MPLFKQLEFAFEKLATRVGVGKDGLVEQALGLPNFLSATAAVALPFRGRDVELEQIARELLRARGASRVAKELHVEWNSRMKSAAGRADYRQKLISLNPRLLEHPSEINRTLLHELAHILTKFRAGRRRILPHGLEWRQACRDLGIADEKRCHNLPFQITERPRRYLYKCLNCRRDFHRARRIKRAVACLACCRAHNGGKFDARFRLRLVRA